MSVRGLKLNKGASLLALFSIPVTLVLISDNILSFAVPIEVERVVNSNFLTGLIIGLASLVGLFSDYIFPPFLKNLTWKIQFVVALVLAIFFPIFSSLGIIYKSVFFFVIMSIFWGAYYELMTFSEEDFIVEEEHRHDYSKDWSVLLSLNVVTNITGPIIASTFLFLSTPYMGVILTGFMFVGLLFTLGTFGVQIKHPDEAVPDKIQQIQKRHRVNSEIFKEFNLWREFLKEMSPVLIATFILNWIDTTIFVVGGLFGLQITGNNGMEWIIIVLYNIPSIFVTYFLFRRPIFKRKKFYEIVALLIAGVSYGTVIFFVHWGLMVLIPMTIGAIAVALSWPLNRAIVSDITKRADRFGPNVLGIYNATASLSYFLGAVIMGFVADHYGYYTMFSILGFISILISVLLLFITPKKTIVNHKILEAINGRDIQT